MSFQPAFFRCRSQFRYLQETGNEEIKRLVYLEYVTPVKISTALVSELTYAREHHRNIKGIGGSNHLVIAL